MTPARLIRVIQLIKRRPPPWNIPRPGVHRDRHVRTRPRAQQRPCFCPLSARRIPVEPKFPADVYVGQPIEENTMGKGLLLWLIGIPIPIILLIWLFGGLH
jgi:hypothetical protein